MLFVLCAAAFAAAAFVGVSLGRALCKGRTPFADGPAAIPVPTWLIVAAGACIGLGASAHASSPVQLTTIGVVLVFLAACVVSDCMCGIVPDLFTLVPLGALVVSAATRRDLAPLISATIVALPFVGAAMLSHGRGMGWGDVKLAALAGALLGARDATLALIVACIAAFVLSRVLRLQGKPMAFAPYLVAGIGFELMTGPVI